MSTRVLQAARSVVLAVALAALVGTTSGQVKPRVKTLTPMDYIEIRQLVNRYAFALDTGRNNGYDYADLFAPDGEFMRPYAKGREQLAALARGPRLGPDNTVHYIMNHVIEPTPNGAIVLNGSVSAAEGTVQLIAGTGGIALNEFLAVGDQFVPGVGRLVGIERRGLEGILVPEHHDGRALEWDAPSFVAGLAVRHERRIERFCPRLVGIGFQ